MRAPGIIEERARAKVNLYLHVVGRRPDGYHLLDSLAVFPAVADIVHAQAAPALSLDVQGPFGAGLATEPDNLVTRAARALAARAELEPHAALTLTKTLPVASGIGGGSADAAATLRALVRLWAVPIADETLMHVAAALGADVPVCLRSQAARMGGIGDVLGDAPMLPAGGMVLANPGAAVSTPAVFQARTGPIGTPAVLPTAWRSVQAMAEHLRNCRNDLETAAVGLCPAVGLVLAWLSAQPDCLLARMSGSGATCFGLFPDDVAAARVADAAPRDWWAWGGALCG